MSVLKSVPDFLTDHIGSREILILGMSPSTKTKPFKGGTFERLKSWMDRVGVPHWDFHNVIHDTPNSSNIKDVDWELLRERVRGRKVIIALGTFVSRVCKQEGFRFIAIDHPSPRNRNFNDPAYEPEMLKRLKKELKDAGF